MILIQGRQGLSEALLLLHGKGHSCLLLISWVILMPLPSPTSSSELKDKKHFSENKQS